MILVDKNIKQMVSPGQLIISGYNSDNVNCISYDLTLGAFPNANLEHLEMIPGEVIIIKTNEQLLIPDNIMGRIAEKNSLMRMGVRVDGPHYQPGHKTYAFLRVQNISGNVIVLEKNMKIAQIIFEELKEVPDVTYGSQPNASFQNEDTYVRFGKYETEYNKHIKSYEDAKEDIENISSRIYGNVLTLMGIIVAIFSLLTVNYQAFSNADLNLRYIIAMNLSLSFCITVMLGIILLIINKGKKKGFSIVYAIILLVLGVVTILFCVGVL